MIAGVIYSREAVVKMARNKAGAFRTVLAVLAVALVAAAAWAFRGTLREGYAKVPIVSCYGAAGPNTICKTCDAVAVAYSKKGWSFDKRKVAQCGTSCYGARKNDDCETCNDVVGAYKANKWAYDTKNFAQCKK